MDEIATLKAKIIELEFEIDLYKQGFKKCSCCNGEGGKAFGDVRDPRNWIDCVTCEGSGWVKA